MTQYSASRHGGEKKRLNDDWQKEEKEGTPAKSIEVL